MSWHNYIMKLQSIPVYKGKSYEDEEPSESVDLFNMYD